MVAYALQRRMCKHAKDTHQKTQQHTHSAHSHFTRGPPPRPSSSDGDIRITVDFICTGVVGQSSRVGVFEIAAIGHHVHAVLVDALAKHRVLGLARRKPGDNQSRKLLCAPCSHEKNCEPPELGESVLAIESVPGSLEIFSRSAFTVGCYSAGVALHAWRGGGGTPL